MGCSIGGRIVLNLALDHAARISRADRTGGRRLPAALVRHRWLNRPDVHGGEVCAALVSGLIAPQSQNTYRDETLWAYKQGGPGVFKGDLYFYRVDGDLRGQVRRSILEYVRFICSRASMISPARRKIRRDRGRYQGAPASPSWSNSVISR